MEKEIEKVRKLYPDATFVGLADGAHDNWTFLEKHTDVQILDYYHATEYVTKAGQAIFKERCAQKETWVAATKDQLRDEKGAAGDILVRWKRLRAK